LFQGVPKKKKNNLRRHHLPRVKILVGAKHLPRLNHQRIMFRVTLQALISVAIKLTRAFFCFAFILAASFIVVAGSHAKSNSSDCLSLVKPLDEKRKKVGLAGGVWGIFAREPALDGHSKDAVKLDSNINKLVETLVYLCETKSGVPYNELASFVTRKIKELGADRFGQEQILLGKPRQDVADWLKYSKIAEANRKRVLELDKIKISIQGARVYIDRYWKMFGDFINIDEILPILPATVALNLEIDDFMAHDPYMALALFEDSQIPYWDIDENYGGS
jgi:hypothetical protein